MTVVVEEKWMVIFTDTDELINNTKVANNGMKD